MNHSQFASSAFLCLVFIPMQGSWMSGPLTRAQQWLFSLGFLLLTGTQVMKAEVPDWVH